jgi:uncharacterized membrane protein
VTIARWTDEEIDQVVGRLLQIGVFIASVVVLAGGAVFLVTHGHLPADFRVFRGEPPALRRVEGIVGGVFARYSPALVQLGLVLLIATPVARVALTLVAFVLQHDRVYVGLTGLVLILLTYGLLWSR